MVGTPLQGTTEGFLLNTATPSSPPARLREEQGLPRKNATAESRPNLQTVDVAQESLNPMNKSKL